MVWLKFAICVLIIFLSGKRIAKYGDIIAEQSGLGRIWIGVILLAVATSLPELFTGISAVVLVGVPDLTIANLFGANVFNLLNLAVLDIAYGKSGSLLRSLKQGHERTAWLSLLVVLLVASCVLASRFSTLSLGWIGWYAPIILLAYILAARAIFRHEQKESASQEVEDGARCESVAGSPNGVYVRFAIAAAFIIGAGCWLAVIGDEIATDTGWESSFVGSLFLAFTTTLPEITVSFSALRIGAPDLAVANMIGSNLFNMAIIPVVDIFYTEGPVLADVSSVNIYTAIAVTAMTVVFIAALRATPRGRLRLSWWNCALIASFLVAAYLNFTLGG